MALRHNHYDAAFEGYLRARRIPYVSVDETRRSLLEQVSLKSMDFIVHSLAGENLLHAFARAEAVSARLRKERPPSNRTIAQLDSAATAR